MSDPHLRNLLSRVEEYVLDERQRQRAFLDEEVTALREAIAERDDLRQQLAAREERIAALEAENDRLRQWARHGETCAAGWDDQACCTCGLAEAVDHV